MISLLVTLVIVGVILYLLFALVPMDPRVKTAIGAIVGLCLFLYCLQVFGWLPASFRLPR